MGERDESGGREMGVGEERWEWGKKIRERERKRYDGGRE